MNLLPWRIELFKQKSRRLLLQTSVMSIVLCLTCFMLNAVNQHFEQQLGEKQNEQQKYQATLNILNTQIAQLRQQTMPQTKQIPIQTEQVLNIIQMLSELPLTQGEIQHFELQRDRVSLEGIAANQKEFEQLQPYIAQYFPDIRLNQFVPKSNNELQFKFVQGDKE